MGENNRFAWVGEHLVAVISHPMGNDSEVKYMEKKWYQSKTVWLNVGVTLTGLLVALGQSPLLMDNIEALSLITTIQGALNIFLRFVSDTPIEKKVI